MSTGTPFGMSCSPGGFQAIETEPLANWRQLVNRMLVMVSSEWRREQAGGNSM